MIGPRFTRTTAITAATFALLASGSAIMAPSAARAVPVLDTNARLVQHFNTMRQMSPRTARKGWLNPAAISGPVVYVSDQNREDFFGIRIYSQSGHNQKPIGEIQTPGAPYGLTVDNSGNLYVASGPQGVYVNGNLTFTNGSVLMYEKGQLTPSKTYTSGIAQPNDVAVGSDGTVYVADYNGDFAIGWVSVYRHGGVEPSAIIQDFYGVPFAVTTDKSNNLLVSYINGFNGAGQIARYSPGSTSGGSNLGVALNYPNGITVDALDNYVVADKNLGIEVFSPAGKTVEQFTASALDVAFNSAQTLLYDAENANGVTVRAYPSGTVINNFGHATPQTPALVAIGIALSPAAPR